jgi:hypothetical protein
VKVEIKDNKVVASGEVSNPREFYLIRGLVDQYPGLAESAVSISPIAMDSIAKTISSNINDPNVLVTAKDNQIVMGGAVESASVRDQAEIIAKVYMPGSANHKNSAAIVNLILVNGEK